MKDKVIQLKLWHVILFSVAFSVLVYFALFNPKTIETSDYAQEKIKLNTTLITYQTKIDSLNFQMDSTRQEIANIRIYYGRQIKDITNYTPSELDKFFTNRY